MNDLTIQIRDAIEFFPWTRVLITLGIVVVIAVVANWLTKRIVLRLVKGVVEHTPVYGESRHVERLARHISYVVPALIIAKAPDFVPELPEIIVTTVKLAVFSFIIFISARMLCDVLDLINDSYEQSTDAAARPIKGYVQVAKILIYGAAILLIIALLTGESPLLLLSGLGAITAVLLLVFRDTILSLVASVQLRSNDMIRVGDWIEMAKLDADGDVIDIALHTVKVQNFDKTITTIPTHRLISESFRNWRGMRDWGARRIKRSLFIDKSTIGFLSSDEWEGLRRFALLRPYIEATQAELDAWNAQHAGGEDGERGAVNKRRPTNIGTFRAYVVAYLKAHPRVSDKGTMIVRQLAPTDLGLPLEIYCFAKTTAWAEYEAIQSDIFDHLLAIMPEFGLFAFQQPSGHDLLRSSEASGAVGAVAGT